MITASEIVATAAIWSLTAIGGFFCIRRTLCSMKARRSGKEQPFH
ncbi:hypothetical protein Geob_3869 [Geotalea daltonii FRC-32]|uniref:Uncharacterized protein n=1 Tax=Geotalea daltonii (strain DSM 22248 / JCM 15807 / FRC-32) TaxID=316067 RepID=A0A068EZY6_GEODF|nr:hypothetical protein Geob_3869 [Geotalea daltonii FRC-32]